MRIGIILHPYGEKQPGGLPRIISGWAEALLSVDQENEYIIFLKEKPKELPKLPGKNWRVEVLGPGRFWLDRLKDASQADTYLFNTPVLPFFWRPPRAVVIALDYPYKYLPAGSLTVWLKRKFISWYHKRSLRRADHIIAVSHSTKNDTVKFFDIDPDKISVVYHGYKKICDVPENNVHIPEKYFFFAGTMKERKNVLNIIKGYEEFYRAHPGAEERLLLCGKNEGEYYEKLLAYIHDHHLDDRVRFTGHLNESQLSFVYRRASALVFPSIIEGTGFPILEALSCGIPVITSNIFGPAELGGNGAALLINPYSFKEIGEAMARIVFEPGIREKLLSNAVTQLKQFSWENTGRETLEILKKSPLKFCFLLHNVKPHNGGGVLARQIISRLQGELKPSIQVLTAEKSNFPGEEIVFSRRWFLSLKRLWKMFREIRKADVVHAFDVFPYGFIATLFSIGSRAKVVITCNGTGSIRYLYMPFHFPLARFAYRHADVLVSISHFTRDEILKRVPGLTFQIIHPGIDLNMFRAPHEEYFEKIKRYEPYILSVGSIRFRKGYKWSIPAFHQTLKDFPDLKYVIIGKKYTDKEYTRLKKLVKDLNLEEKVFFIENVETDEELAAYYHRAKLFCLMSFNVGHDVEGFGIVFLEAAAAGIPVIGSKGCGAEDAMINGGNGLLVPEDDIAGFGKAIISILGDKNRYEKMSETSREFVKDFSWDKKIAQYLEVYRNLGRK